MVLPQYLYKEQQRIEAYAREYGLKFFPQIFEILDYKTMNEVAAFGGFPTRYPHWRFGMEYAKLSKSYSYGLSKIYEMVINNNPCYAYLLEGNSLVDQKLVMAHVSAHNDFFMNNHYFSRTNRKMVDAMANHATRVRRHMARFGVDRVERFIDRCLSLENLIDPMSMFIKRAPVAVDRRRGALAAPEEETPDQPKKLRADKSYMEHYINPPPDPDEIAKKEEEDAGDAVPRFPAHPVADVLLFLLHHAPLKPWQRDIMEIVREEAYYFAPQGMTKIMNEGWATYWHSTIMTQKVLTDAEVIDYADHASAVLGGGPSLNPYKIGVELYRHVERRWNMGRFGKEYDVCDDLEARRTWDRQLGLGRERIFEVRRHYNDVMFIDEFFTEEFCREQLFYTYGWNKRSGQWEIQGRQYRKIKEQLLTMLTNMGNPRITVVDANHHNRGELLLLHGHEGTDLKLDWAADTLRNLQRVWRRPVSLQTVIKDKPVIVSFDGTKHSRVEGDAVGG